MLHCFASGSVVEDSSWEEQGQNITNITLFFGTETIGTEMINLNIKMQCNRFSLFHLE